MKNYNEFKILIDQYLKIQELAKIYQVKPEKIIGFFLHIGTEVLSRSNDLMLNEFKDRFVEYLEKNKSPFTLDDFNEAHKYFKKVFNEVKK